MNAKEKDTIDALVNQVFTDKSPNKVPTQAGSNSRTKEGFDILRLKSPSIDELSDDFLCGACQKIVNVPLECTNQ